MKNLTLYILFSILLFSCKKDEAAKIVQKHLVKVEKGFELNGGADYGGGTVLEIGYKDNYTKLDYVYTLTTNYYKIEYDGTNKIISMSGLQKIADPFYSPNIELVSTKFSYDSSGNVIKTTKKVGDIITVTDYGYDSLNRIVEINSFAEHAVFYYIGNNRLPKRYEGFLLSSSFPTYEFNFSDKPSPYKELKILNYLGDSSYQFDNHIIVPGVACSYSGDYLVKERYSIPLDRAEITKYFYE